MVATCVSIDREKHNKERGWNGGLSQTTERFESNLTAVDPVAGEVKKSVHLRYPNYSGTLATAGGLIFLGLLDGTVAAFDDITLDELWRQAISGDHVGAKYCRQGQARQHAGTQGPAQRDRAVCLRAVTAATLEDDFSAVITLLYRAIR